jgi:hypothetical protein
MAGYDRRIVGITTAGTRSAANAAINARFGANSIDFGVPVGPVGEDAVTHWLVCSKTRADVLGVFASETQKLHGGPGTTTVSGGESQTITRDSDGAVLGAWSTYTGGLAGWIAWLDTHGLRVQWGTIAGGSPIDTIIAQARAAEPGV